MVAPANTANREKTELWKCRVCGKRGKPKAGFPLFPRAAWKSRQQRARFPHFHSSGDDASGLRPPLDGGRFAPPNSQEVIVVDREK